MAYELEVKRCVDSGNGKINLKINAIKKKQKNMIQPPKSTMEQIKKEFLAPCSFLEKLLIYTYVIRFKVLDGNYYKTNKDYSFWLKLNPFHPISYLLIIYMILKGILTNQLDYDEFLHNLKSVFNWNEEEL